MNVHVAIPSYRRAETLASKTLPELRRLGVPDDAITVFLSDPDEGGAYREAIGRDSIRLAAGRPGVGENRNLIHRFYPEGDRVLSIDDDVRSILIRRNAQLTQAIEPYEFSDVVGLGFDSAAGGLWGVHPVPNAFFQRTTVSRDLRYIAAGLYGFTSRRDPALDVTLEDKEDFERSIKWYLADGFVTRLNWISLRTIGYKGAGGMQETRTPERVDASARELAARYPTLCSLNLKKKSGWAEVRLRDRRPQPDALT